MKIQNALKNSVSGSFLKLTKIILNFITRTVFIYMLGSEFVGLNGLFLNVLLIFSLSELGIELSIAYCLYKPVSENDEYKINAYMTIFAKLYRVVAIVILTLGIITMPFVHYLIDENPFDLNFLRFVFLLFIIEVSVSYLFSYRSIILKVNEKLYTINVVQIIAAVAIFAFQVFFLVLTRNYIAYKAAEVVIQVAVNICLFIIAAKYFPNVKVGMQYKLSKEDISILIDRIKSAFLNRLSPTVTATASTLFISYFFGIYTTGLFANYNLIITVSVFSIIARILNGATAGFGNLIAKGNDIKRDFYNFFFIGFWIASFSFTFLLILINPFIILWIGNDFLLPVPIVVLMLSVFYIHSSSYVVMVMREAAGLFVHDKKVSLLKPVINIVCSLTLIHFYGLIGVFLGALISSVVCDIILFPFYLYKKLIKENLFEYFKRYGIYLCVTGINSVLCLAIKHLLNNLNNQLIIFLISCFVCITIPNLIIVILFNKTDEFKYFLTVFRKNILKRTT